MAREIRRRGTSGQKIKNNQKFKLTKPKTWKKKHWAMIIAIILLILFLIFKVITPYFKTTQPVSILVVGSDVNEYRLENNKNHEYTDALMVLTFNPDTYQVVMTSIPRDTTIDYTCQDYQDSVNRIYGAYGMNCLEDSIANFLQVPIDYYIKVNFDEFIAIINEIGGITITPTKTFCEQDAEGNAGAYCFTNGEEVELTGEEALAYARHRASDNDYLRGERQQQIIEALVVQLLSDGLTYDEVVSMYNMVETNLPLISTWEYYNYFVEIFGTIKGLKDNNREAIREVPTNVWRGLFEATGYQQGIQGKFITQEEIIDFMTYIASGDYYNEITEYFFTHYQMENQLSNDKYFPSLDELQEISNALNTNLNRLPQKVRAPQFERGYTDIWTLNSQGSVSKKTTPQEPVQIEETEPEEEKVVVDDKAPTLELTTSNITLTLLEAAQFNPLTYIKTANDPEDGDLKNKVVVTGDIETIKAGVVGTYVINYSVTDSFGNEVQKKLTVNVIEE